MANKKSKSIVKREIPLRTAGEKVSASPERPSQRLFAEVKQQLNEELNKSVIENKADSIPPPTTPYHRPPPPTTTDKSVSPERDFTKVANSINRDVMPSGLFKGTSKNTYDALYQKTRGAIRPIRAVKAVQSDLLIWTGLSHNTLRTHLKHLQAIGLLKIHYKLGDNHGADYEVFLPEEVPQIIPPPTPLHHLPSPTQLLGGGTPQKLVGGGGGFMPVNVGDELSSKTSLKTEEGNDDDEGAALSALREVFAQASRKIIGSGLLKNQQDNWKELAQILVMELEIAAARTDSISNVPAFLTEHLRRRLLRKPEGSASSGKSDSRKSEKGISHSLEVGRAAPLPLLQDEQDYDPEPLTEEGRKAVLKTMQGYITNGQEGFVMSFEESYTKEDWTWLSARLEKTAKNAKTEETNVSEPKVP